MMGTMTPQFYGYILDTRPFWNPTPDPSTNAPSNNTSNAHASDNTQAFGGDRTKNAISQTANKELALISEAEVGRIKGYYFLKDAKMALGSALLKRWFVLCALDDSVEGSEELSGSDGLGRFGDDDGVLENDTEKSYGLQSIHGRVNSRERRGKSKGRLRWSDLRFTRRGGGNEKRERERGKPCFDPQASRVACDERLKAEEACPKTTEQGLGFGVQGDSNPDEVADGVRDMHLDDRGKGHHDVGAEEQDGLEDWELDFNVTHQAGLVLIAGVRYPRNRPSSSYPPHSLHLSSPSAHLLRTPSQISQTPVRPPQIAPLSHQKQFSANLSSNPARNTTYSIGTDLTCTTERRNRDLATIEQDGGGIRGFGKFVDMHAEVFSDADLANMKHHLQAEEAETNQGGDTKDRKGEQAMVDDMLRRFYAYWALKEAYVKMEGEALLAEWLRDVEFGDVHVPAPASVYEPASVREPARYSLLGTGGVKGDVWGETVENIMVYHRGRRREDVRIFLHAYGGEWLVATAVLRQGRGDGREDGRADEKALKAPKWEEVDIDTVIRAAEGDQR